MEFDRQLTIAQQSSKCLKLFKDLLREYKEHDDTIAIQEHSPEDVSDALARFRTWIDNIGALQRVWQIASGARTQQTWGSSDPLSALEFSDEEDDESDEDDSDAGTDRREEAGFSDRPSEVTTESQMLFSSILEAIASLLKLSMFIRRSTRGNKFAKSSSAQKYETQYDINHVRDRYPSASRSPHLVERLGKANAQRRQWLSYQRRHRDKLAMPAALDDPGTSFGLNSAAGRVDDVPQSPTSQREALSGPSIWTEEHKHPYSVLSSTKASTFYHNDERPREPMGTETSETSCSETSYGDVGFETNLIPQPPPESADQSPFECPYCFSIIAITGNSSWRKHVFADLAAYVCTQDHCSHPLFESREQWFNHELEEHRRQWICTSCQQYFPSIDPFKDHMCTEHHGSFTPNQLEALATRAARPMHRILASACPLCDYPAVNRGKLNAHPDEDPITVPIRTFRNHLGRHLEQLALFVLPKQDLMEQNDDIGESKDASAGQVTISGNAGDSDDNERSTSETGSEQRDPELHTHTQRRGSQIRPRIDAEIENEVADVNQRMDEVIAKYASFRPAPEDLVFDTLESPPDLAFKWMPPMDFTPTAKDFEVDDVDLMPRREEPMFGGDIFTPGWVRGYGSQKEGFCGRCSPGVWHNIEDFTYENNLTYVHGIASSGLSLPRPSRIRQLQGKNGPWQAYCETCCGWRHLRKTEAGWNWFRHCVKEHGASAMIPGNQHSPAYHASKGREGQEGLAQDDLIKAIRMDDRAEFETILSQKPGLDASTDKLGRTPLHYAAERGGLTFMKILLLLHRNPSPETVVSLINAKSLTGETCLMLAASQGHKDVVAWLYHNRADVRMVSADGRTALDEAAEAGFMHILGFLLSRLTDDDKREFYRRLATRKSQHVGKAIASGGKDLKPEYIPTDRSDTAGLPPLHAAIVQGNMQVIKDLLERGVDIEDFSATGETPLMVAASKSHHAAVQLLLRYHGANVNATSVKGWTTLMHAVRNSNHSVVHQLTDHGADVNHLSPDRWTALAEATYQGDKDIIALLLSCGADTESRSSHDWTPLMHACYRGDEVAVRLLLRFGARTDVSSDHDETAILLAAAGGYTGIVRELLNAGAAPEPAWAKGPKDESEEGRQQASMKAIGEPEDRAHARGWTPLMLACQSGHREIAEILLARGVNTEVRSPHNKTAMDIALENGWMEIEQVLKEFRDAR
ncbi:MAG: hypothetical protein LQ345_006153 [Seirophora villosa]|nr:MAG: hypothetical protein LQ345_006153 [Seirophora villosa]